MLMWWTAPLPATNRRKVIVATVSLKVAVHMHFVALIQKTFTTCSTVASFNSTTCTGISTDRGSAWPSWSVDNCGVGPWHSVERKISKHHGAPSCNCVRARRGEWMPFIRKGATLEPTPQRQSPANGEQTSYSPSIAMLVFRMTAKFRP